MTEYTIKLSATLPKGSDPNGFDDAFLAQELCDSQLRTGTTAPRVALLVYGVKTAERMKDGNHRATVEPRWIEPVDTEAGRRLAERLLGDEFLHRTGAGMLPYELAALLKSAFADLPRTHEEIDEGEERERENMSPLDELKRHLERVHGVENARSLTETEVEEKHRADHEGLALGPLNHDPEWHGWTRADLEAAEIETDGEDGSSVPDSPAELAEQGGDATVLPFRQAEGDEEDND